MDALNDSLVLSLWGRVTIFGQYRGMLFIESTSREDLAPVVPAVFDCTRLVASAGPSGVGRRHLRLNVSRCVTTFFIGVEPIVNLLLDR